jgi:hypothetical protein
MTPLHATYSKTIPEKAPRNAVEHTGTGRLAPTTGCLSPR